MTQKGSLVILRLFARTKAGVAELADARDSKSRDLHWSCGFDPHLQHQIFPAISTLADFPSSEGGNPLRFEPSDLFCGTNFNFRFSNIWMGVSAIHRSCGQKALAQMQD